MSYSAVSGRGMGADPGCISAQAWISAQLACNAKLSSVKGFGAAAYVLPPQPTLMAPPPAASAPIDPNDPCSIASQKPCLAPAVCPPGLSRICQNIPRQATMGAHAGEWGTVSVCQCLSPSNPVAVGPTSAPVPVMQASAGGFQHWGLLAALAAGGAVIYFATRPR